MPISEAQLAQMAKVQAWSVFVLVEVLVKIVLPLLLIVIVVVVVIMIVIMANVHTLVEETNNDKEAMCRMALIYHISTTITVTLVKIKIKIIILKLQILVIKELSIQCFSLYCTVQSTNTMKPQTHKLKINVNCVNSN